MYLSNFSGLQRIGSFTVKHPRHRCCSLRASENGQEPARSIPMPGGVWLNPIYHNYDILYGSTFVIQRERVGGPGLVLSKWKTDGIQVWVPKVKGGLVTSVQPGPLQRLPPRLAPPGARNAPDLECNACTSMVLAGAQARDVEGELPNSFSPRRTHKMRFTCDRCGTVNTNFVNPHAWEKGTVFCRCQGCKQVHLIRDEKGIFWTSACMQDAGFNNKKKHGEKKMIKIPSSLPQDPLVDKTVGGQELL